MTPPATGEKTPKRKRNDAELALAHPITPGPASMPQEDAIRALIVALTAATTTAAGAATGGSAASPAKTDSSSTDESEDIKFDYGLPDDTVPPVQQPPAVPKCSLTSLPTAFTTFAENASKKVLALLMQKRAKTTVSEKLRSKSFIPVSLKSKFELTASPEVRGCADFFHLAAASSVAMSTCIEEIKGYMADVADMENKIIDSKIHELLFTALDGFTRLLLINSLGRTERLPVREFALATLTKYIHYFANLDNFGLGSEDAVFGKYKEVLADPNPVSTSKTVDIEFNQTHGTDMAILASLINDTFIVHWQRKLASMKAKETAFLLDTAQKKILRDTACADTAKAIAKEKTMDDTQMNVVINDKLAQKTKELATKIGRLENMLSRTQQSDTEPPKPSRKNSNGGAKTSRASIIKKTNTPRGNLKKTKKPNARAAAPDNASSDANKPKKKPNSRKPPSGANKSKTVSFKSTQKRS
jgi:hypothetical protein